jgi:hypothetical protein
VPLTAAPPSGRRESPSGRHAPPRTLIVELVGPAGAGKTALLRALGRHHTGLRAGLSIDRVRYLPAISRHTLALLPTGIEVLRDDRRSLWPVMLHLIRLRTLPTVLAHEMAARPAAIVLDEGPLFSLGRLSVFQRAHESRTRLGQAWQRQLDRWTRLLDVVIWLDAPDPILAQRIRTRFKPHQVKDDPEQAVYEFLGRYRQAYKEIRARVVSAGRTRMIDLDTSALSADQAVPLVLAALTARPGPDSRPAR